MQDCGEKASGTDQGVRAAEAGLAPALKDNGWSERKITIDMTDLDHTTWLRSLQRTALAAEAQDVGPRLVALVLAQCAEWQRSGLSPR